MLQEPRDSLVKRMHANPSGILERSKQETARCKKISDILD